MAYKSTINFYFIIKRSFYLQYIIVHSLKLVKHGMTQKLELILICPGKVPFWPIFPGLRSTQKNLKDILLAFLIFQINL